MSETAPAADHPNWVELINKSQGRGSPVAAVTFLRRRTDTASHPVYLECADGHTYVVKPIRNDAIQGRMLFNDQIIARLGSLIGAAVPTVSLVGISKELIDLNPHPQQGMGHCQPAVCHGSKPNAL
jgi:hypothetical protein